MQGIRSFNIYKFNKEFRYMGFVKIPEIYVTLSEGITLDKFLKSLNNHCSYRIVNGKPVVPFRDLDIIEKKKFEGVVAKYELIIPD